MLPPKKVLFLCTGNSCRSQMAEAISNHSLAGRWRAFSAGTQPSGFVHPIAVQVLEEIGIHHQGTSKAADIFRNQVFDLVITVCDDAAETCPVWLGQSRSAHFSLRDPAITSGTAEEVLTVFRQIRDEIRTQIIPFLETFE